MYVQWPYILSDFYPRAIFKGSLLCDSIELRIFKNEKLLKIKN